MSTKRTRMYDEIARHGRHLQAIYPQTRDMDPIALSKKLFRLEREANHASVRYANGDIDSSAWERISDSVLEKVNRILGPGPSVFVNADPRGYALKIDDAVARDLSIHRDMGGYGIISPQFEGASIPGEPRRRKRQG